ncbi:MAG: hypothetical protein ACK6CP_20510 [Pseudanabaena sp.]|nr:hypothetical protein [Pseudanabaena sp. M176S2SP2A07QC]MCA6538948.1 hypothetical protein [Pseudanabaena sp. M037S2SP2A07QC]MCA6545232.1 hypothetical protein [Pseudanabaena sp. M074S1SP2A07QC]MCA6546368.1 hypothetical protein [Pseudanabaena sp. M152S2SP2A07QC]MCA6564399.1 hypothetical protein [Pseudanabaena sp. M151S2SP2A07QC]MCA6567611.1 hypothetical protein [Pseudanabaena sp. M065S1SP2A07QC]MCA6578768.1 hypothetical protein [Pseudanabaena sp. M085S1SP2A07QC]
MVFYSVIGENSEGFLSKIQRRSHYQSKAVSRDLVIKTPKKISSLNLGVTVVWYTLAKSKI